MKGGGGSKRTDIIKIQAIIYITCCSFTVSNPYAQFAPKNTIQNASHQPDPQLAPILMPISAPRIEMQSIIKNDKSTPFLHALFCVKRYMLTPICVIIIIIWEIFLSILIFRVHFWIYPPKKQ